MRGDARVARSRPLFGVTLSVPAKEPLPRGRDPDRARIGHDRLLLRQVMIVAEPAPHSFMASEIAAISRRRASGSSNRSRTGIDGVDLARIDCALARRAGAQRDQKEKEGVHQVAEVGQQRSLTGSPAL